MKRLLFLLFPLYSLGQPKPPKDCNTIVVDTADASLLLSAFHARGYHVAYDGVTEYTTISRKMSNNGSLMISAKLSDGKTYISGTFENREITPELFSKDISFGGHNLWDSFKWLQEIAGDLHASFTYIKVTTQLIPVFSPR